jgi:PAS domain S-box-containing protein
MPTDIRAARRRKPSPAHDGRFVIGPRGVIEDVDAAGCSLLGYAHSEIVGLHGSEIVPHDAQAATAVTLDRMRRGEFARRTGRLRQKDGTVIAVEVTARALPDGRLLLTVRRQDNS